MLLEYLRQEYEKNPDQFPFPKELIEDYMNKQSQQQQQRQDTESVRDIRSDEMVVEETSGKNHIEGGGQEIEEDEDEDDEVRQHQLQQLQ